MTTTASPRATSIPAVMAIWWPKLRAKSTTRTRRSFFAMSSRTASVPSEEPSLTYTNSYAYSGRSRRAAASSWWK